jgi:hypothetical protein
MRVFIPDLKRIGWRVELGAPAKLLSEKAGLKMRRFNGHGARVSPEYDKSAGQPICTAKPPEGCDTGRVA